MDITAIIIAVMGVLSNFVTWLLSKRKYTAEVNTNEIENLKQSLDFYQKIVEDNDKQLKFYIKMAEENRFEVYRLKSVVHSMLNDICLSENCPKRKYYTEMQIRELLGEIKNPNTNEFNP